ncbi:MAG: hypothetical protein GFH27_549303n251 [Chloroflexi bacterium AL-W]|nr:hypothetical protein [Chloroflexi bacterium AL-N1]NOK68136.1 hypothetical protein [Chloroflexi bacterium AL-N10]NOK73476.1 hypothetical protein [Chloroflexi bacterium AL-N5]NOK83390.1 hypothetical protein [Chloroflexi bacterium AL-W]NOK87807.1 hypothetical protein [Chloroflexi bacterium AL-N15]
MEHLRHVLPFVARYRLMLFFGFLCALVDAGATATVPQIVRFAVDDLNTRGVVAQDLLQYGGWLLLLAMALSFSRFGLRLFVSGAAFRVEFDIRKALFHRLILLEQRFYTQTHTGDLMARVTNDLTSVRMFLGPGVASLMIVSLFGIIAAILMFATSVVLSTVVLALLPFVVIIFAIVGARMRRIFREVQDQFGVITTRAQENFSGIRTIKAYAQEEEEIRLFAQENEDYRKLNIRYVLLSGFLWPIIILVLGLINAAVLLIGGQFVAVGTMSLGDLVAFNTYLALLAFPMIALGWTVNLYQQASASMGRIAEILHREPEIISPPSEHLTSDSVLIQGDIEFRNVGIRFVYEEYAAQEDTPTRWSTNVEEQWVLRHISFRVSRGTSLAIVGGTGTGKTTLVNLLARVRDPDEGHIFIDGQDVRTLPLDALRRSLGYVPQDTFLFSVPLRENVTFGCPDATPEEIDKAVAVSRLSNDLAQFPDGLDTLIGERGVTMSGGQKQRTAIARAILRDPSILVLDDALSSVDTNTAAQILKELRSVMSDRTSIIIAHRIASVKDADQIVLLHDGRIIEQGIHRELIALGGHYASMYRRELLQREHEDL